MPAFESSVDDALGLWSTAPQPAAVSFGVESEPAAPEGLVYRVNLSANPLEAEQVFSGNEAAFARMEVAMAGMPARLDGLVARTQESQASHKSAGVSFAVGAESQESGPEAELLAQLAQVDQNASGRGAEGAVNFGIGEMIDETWGASKAQFDALIAQIDRDVLHFAWVETTISSNLVARTSVDWSGDAQTIWDQAASSEQSLLHQRNLRFVTQTRGMRLRLFVTVASGAARVAGLIATPGGAVLALPAVYQYVTKILAQARELQSIQTQ